ncbi:hypothetical protein [Haloechinothrix halophila]|uniref:hypothetical protein n=1 Tax=Haloechinothrix halophila TaxID=1069073 RepID=UPI00040279B5|nr:hypothetical protein [Haloechinothrix halophila]
MSTRTDFYNHDRWLGSLATDADPRHLPTVPPGRLALTATDPFTFADAVTDLLDVWDDEQRGTAHHPRDGWPWPWPDSTASDWIIRFHHGRVEITAGNYTHWHGDDPPGTTPAEPERVHVIAEIIDQRFQVSIVHHPGRYTEYTLPAHDRTYRDAIADTVHRHTGRTVTAIAAIGHIGDGAHRYTATLADQPELAEPAGHNTRMVTP